MAQGFKKGKSFPQSSSSTRHSQSSGVTKRGARIIKPKKAAAIQTHNLRKKLTSQHTRLAEQTTAVKARNPGSSGKSSGLTIVKVDPAIIKTAEAAKARRKNKKVRKPREKEEKAEE